MFKKYYFPFGSKFVAFSDIRCVEKNRPTFRNGRWRIWGTGDFQTWFPRDRKRPAREAVFLLGLASQRTRIGFTVEDTKRFEEALITKGIAIDFEHSDQKTTDTPSDYSRS